LATKQATDRIIQGDIGRVQRNQAKVSSISVRTGLAWTVDIVMIDKTQ